MGDETQRGDFPWFPLWVADFQAGTVHLTPEEVGVYLRLLMWQWDQGKLPDDLARLERITQASPEVISEVVAQFFPAGRNRKLDRVREEQYQRAERRTGAARKAARARWDAEAEKAQDDPVESDAKGNAKAMQTHSDRNADAMRLICHSDSDLDSDLDSDSEADSDSTKDKQTNKAISRRTLVSDAMWETFKQTYPPRQGTQQWARAREQANKLLNAGVDWADIMAGVRRYRAQLEAHGKLGTEFVKQAQFWLSPSAQLWTEDYPITDTQPQARRQSLSAAAAWAREGEPK